MSILYNPVPFYIKDLDVHTDNKLHFQDHVKYIISQSTRRWGLIRNIIFNLSSIKSIFKLYIALLRSKLEYASVVWNSITWTDARKVCSPLLVRYCYTLALQEINLHLTYEEAPPRCCLSHSSLFWIQILSLCSGNCWSPSSSSAYSRLCIVSVCSSCKNCPSARSVSAANVVCKNGHMFESRNILLRHIL
jgi:hypothetical protein